MGNQITRKQPQDESYITARVLALGALIAVAGFACYCAAHSFNPDPDAFWLVETGRWIVENRAVPRINPWTYNVGLSIIIQQPLCAVLNYLWYARFSGLSGLWGLAAVENAILIGATLYLSSIFSEKDKKTAALLSAVLVEVLFISCGLVTTRPYQLTAASMMVLVAHLEKARLKGKIPFVPVALATLFQANYQMASLIMVLCFLLCYMLDGAVKCIRQGGGKKPLILWGITYLEWGLIGLVNPYGADGFLYLSKSMPALSVVSGKILEMASPSMSSFPCIVTTASVLFFFLAGTKGKEWFVSDALLVFGSVFAACLAARNFWMVAIAFAAMYSRATGRPKKKDTPSKWDKGSIRLALAQWLPVWAFKAKEILLAPRKEKGPLPHSAHKALRYVILAVSLVFFLLMAQASLPAGMEAAGDAEQLLSFIREEIPPESRVYTSFNTGGIMELAGRRVFIDARPELYGEEIAGEDVLQEWMSLEWGDPDTIPTYVSSHNWDYYFVSKGTPISYYFHYSATAECIYDGAYGEIYTILR